MIHIEFEGISLHKENNKQSEEILTDNHKRLSNQCRVVYDALKAGVKLTVKDAMIDYNIGDLRRRVCDLRQHGVDIKDNILKGGVKEFYL